MKKFKEVLEEFELPTGWSNTTKHQLDYDVQKKIPHGHHLIAVVQQKTAKSFQMILDPEPEVIAEFGKSVFRFYSPKLDARTLIKFNISNGYWQFIDLDMYENEGKIRWKSAFKMLWVDLYDVNLLKKYA